VAVPSPLREVSGTHLEIQQEGYTVVVRDVGSTNGTIVTAPGTAPSLLSPGESRVVPVGCILDLGDGNVLEIVAPAAVRLPSAEGSASW
jgi:pSer/pThr/pTyr-binding forkhead associated (FHA) protein